MLNTEDEKEMTQIEKQCSNDHSNDTDYTSTEFLTDSPLINVTGISEERKSKSGFEKRKKRLKAFQKYEDHNYNSKRVTFENPEQPAHTGEGN